MGLGLELMQLGQTGPGLSVNNDDAHLPGWIATQVLRREASAYSKGTQERNRQRVVAGYALSSRWHIGIRLQVDKLPVTIGKKGLYLTCQNPLQPGRAAACRIHVAICSSSNPPS